MSDLRKLAEAVAFVGGPWKAIETTHLTTQRVIFPKPHGAEVVADVIGGPGNPVVAYIAAASPDVILALLDENERLRAALDGLLGVQYTVTVSGHDVDCDLVQTTGLPCSCGKNDAIRQAAAAVGWKTDA